MSTSISNRWEAKKTDETRDVEATLRQGDFDQVDAYRYNVASIRVRVIDRRFEGLTHSQRADLVEPFLDKLPEETQQDIITLFLFVPAELEQTPKTIREYMRLVEFEDPSPSML